MVKFAEALLIEEGLEACFQKGESLGVLFFVPVVLAFWEDLLLILLAAEGSVGLFLSRADSSEALGDVSE